MSDAALSLEAITRRFGSIVAVDNASFTLRRGRVHALLGENGAGKTTLMRIAFGMLQPDSGTIRVNDTVVDMSSPTEAIERGIGMVHQHFTLVPAMTVAENVSLGGHGRFAPREAASRVRDVASRAGLSIDPEAVVGTLGSGAQQRCEIVKALSRDVNVLILDEPTAVLAPEEARELLRWIRQFADSGRSVVLITHKLRDALSVADDFTVLRNARVVLSASRADVNVQQLAAAMLGETNSAVDVLDVDVDVDRDAIVGRDRLESKAEVAHTSAADKPVIASASQVVVRDEHGLYRLNNVSIDVHAGEIVGIAAIEGAGQHDLLRVLAGRTPVESGRLVLPNSIGFIPEDRHRDALLLDEDLVSNVALRDANSRQGSMPWRELAQESSEVISRFDVRGAVFTATARTLSGGNQQRLVLGRELYRRPELLVAENPTRGLDFNATRSIQSAFRETRDAGTAIVFYSSDLDEVLALSDRIFVLRGGALVESVRDRNAVGHAMLSAS